MFLKRVYLNFHSHYFFKIIFIYNILFSIILYICIIIFKTTPKLQLNNPKYIIRKQDTLVSVWFLRIENNFLFLDCKTYFLVILILIFF